MGSNKDENVEAQDNEKKKGMSQTEYDLCCFLIPLYVFGLPLLLSGLMTYFFWDNEDSHRIGLMLMGISGICLSMGTVLMIVYFMCVGGKRRSTPTTTIIVHRNQDDLGGSGEDIVPQPPRYVSPDKSEDVPVFDFGYVSGEKASSVRAQIVEPSTPGQVIPEW